LWVVVAPVAVVPSPKAHSYDSALPSGSDESVPSNAISVWSSTILVSPPKVSSPFVASAAGRQLSVNVTLAFWLELLMSSLEP